MADYLGKKVAFQKKLEIGIEAPFSFEAPCADSQARGAPKA